MSQASKVPAECVRMNHDMVREGVFDLKDLEQLILRPVSISHCKSPLCSRAMLSKPYIGHHGCKQSGPPLPAHPSPQPTAVRRRSSRLLPALRPMLCGSPRVVFVFVGAR